MHESMSKNVSTRPIIPHCEYGDHDVTDGTFLMRCAFCNRSVCIQHHGNPEATAGSYVSCLDHIKEVADMNHEWLQKFRAKHQQAGAPESAFAIGTPVRILPVREDSAQYHGATGVIASVHDAHLDAEFLPVRIGAAILNFRRDELEVVDSEPESEREA